MWDLDCLLDGHEFKAQAKRLLIKMPGVSRQKRLRYSLATSLEQTKKRSFSALGRGEYYWIDLIGCFVETSDGAKLGKIESMIETGSSDGNGNYGYKQKTSATFRQ